MPDAETKPTRTMKPARNYGLPKHVDTSELVPDATRANHFVWPHPGGNPALDEVYHMPAEFADERSEEEEEGALKKAARIREKSAQTDAEAIIAEAQARADAIIAEAEGQAKALKARGTMQPGPRDATHTNPEDLDPDDPDYEDLTETAEDRANKGKRGRRPPPPPRDANMIDPTVVAASNPGGGETVPGRDNPAVRESSA